MIYPVNITPLFQETSNLQAEEAYPWRENFALNNEWVPIGNNTGQAARYRHANPN